MAERISLARLAVVLIPIAGLWMAAQARSKSARRRRRSELGDTGRARDRRDQDNNGTDR